MDADELVAHGIGVDISFCCYEHRSAQEPIFAARNNKRFVGSMAIQKIAHNAVERIWVFESDEVRAFDERQLCTGDALSNQARMRFLYHIVDSRHNKCGYVQLGKLNWVDVRFIDHQAKQFEPAFVVRRNGLFVFLVYFTARLLGQSFGEQVAAIEDEALYA